VCASTAAIAGDDVLSQLRNEDGTTGVRTPTKPAALAKPAQPDQSIASAGWKKPTWTLGPTNVPMLSAKGGPGSGSAGYLMDDSSGDDLSLKVVLGWDSEFIFRGQQLAKQIAVGGVEANYGNAYVGVWGNVPSPDDFDSYQNRIDIYAGYGFDIGSNLYADAGVNGYIRSNSGALFNQKDSVEGYFGLSMDGPLSPSLYGFYDIELDRYTIEASAEYTLPFGRTDLVLGGTAGYSGGKGIDYAYFQADAELVHNFTRNASIGIGGHFAVSSEKTFLEGLALTGDNTTWFGIRLRSGI